MKFLILNPNEIHLVVPVIHSDGRKDSVNLQRRSRVTLREGMRVNPEFLKQNPKALKIHEVA